MDFYCVMKSLNEYNEFDVCTLLTLIIFMEQKYRLVLTTFSKCPGKADHALVYIYQYTNIPRANILIVTKPDEVTVTKCLGKRLLFVHGSGNSIQAPADRILEL